VRILHIEGGGELFNRHGFFMAYVKDFFLQLSSGPVDLGNKLCWTDSMQVVINIPDQLFPFTLSCTL
jgi:hypothetical protein